MRKENNSSWSSIKKVLLAVLLTVAICALCRPIKINAEEKTNKGSYAITCYKCQEYYHKYRVGCYKCIAWRRYDVPHKEIDGNIYTTYRCQHGHILLVSLTSEDKK